jgi:hypothetical protein
MDKYVIDVLLRALLVRGIILQTRPKTQLTLKSGQMKVLR